MTYNVEFKNFEDAESAKQEQEIRRLIEREVNRINKRAKSLAPDPIFVRVLVEKNPAHKLYSVSMTLDVPEKTLATKEEGRDIEAVIKGAFAEIERQFDEYRYFRRGAPDWKRIARRKELRQEKAGIQPDQELGP